MSDKQPSDKKNRVKTGKAYEQRAAKYFQEQGYEIVEQNWHDSHREIDLIATKGNKIIFVEVKSVGTTAYGHPAERIDKHKKFNLIQAAQQYIIKNNIQNYDLQFDVVTFIGEHLEHFPNAISSDEN